MTRADIDHEVGKWLRMRDSLLEQIRLRQFGADIEATVIEEINHIIVDFVQRMRALQALLP
jgi:hypothetical protein